MSFEKIGELTKLISGSIALLGMLMSGVWFVGKPYAEDFIKQSVDQRLTTVETAVAALKTVQAEQGISQLRTESDLATLKASSRDEEEYLKLILKKLSGL